MNWNNAITQTLARDWYTQLMDIFVEAGYFGVIFFIITMIHDLMNHSFTGELSPVTYFIIFFVIGKIILKMFGFK